ncbi:hypothetical protein GQ53DRAFT_259962 [Thozetella sp. PMI_491]|nr:hypothetical protein GQ53DRAFT_259962 [Thozetella sp. PMI_491]
MLRTGYLRPLSLSAPLFSLLSSLPASDPNHTSAVEHRAYVETGCHSVLWVSVVHRLRSLRIVPSPLDHPATGGIGEKKRQKPPLSPRTADYSVQQAPQNTQQCGKGTPRPPVLPAPNPHSRLFLLQPLYRVDAFVLSFPSFALPPVRPAACAAASVAFLASAG